MDSRKPLVPDRPGRYLCMDGTIVSIQRLAGNGRTALSTDYVGYWSDGDYFNDGKPVPKLTIYARAPDDAAWCLAQAQLFAEAVDSVVIPTTVYTVLSQTHKAVCTIQNSAIAEDAKKLRADFLERTKRNADKKAKP